MRYLSVCSGIEAATVAWDPLGWDAAGFSEIDKFPSAVLKHHYPEVPNFGDFTTIKADDVGAIDILVGGTPCQSFSVAGLRGGLADDRGNLALEFLRLAQRARPRWLVWENVPGVLSSAGGRDFGAILGGMVECGYGFAYRVLDAQYFGLAQRRKRVFVVGYLGDWRRAAAVLFERDSLSWNPPPRSQAWKEVAGTLGSRATAGGGFGTDFDLDVGVISHSLNAKGGSGSGRIDAESETFVTHSLRAEGFDASEDGTGRGIPLTVATLDANYGKLQGCSGQDAGHGHSHLIPIQSVQAVREKRQNGIGIGQDGDSMFTLTGRDRHAVAFSCKDHGADAGDIAPTLRAMEHSGSHANAGGQVAVAFHENQRGEITVNDTAGSLKVGGGKPGQGYPAVETGSTVRRLTPRECERLQGFPDDYTAIPYRGKPAADGPRYRALGNSMAVPVMAWVGKQIQSVEAISRRAS